MTHAEGWGGKEPRHRGRFIVARVALFVGIALSVFRLRNTNRASFVNRNITSLSQKAFTDVTLPGEDDPLTPGLPTATSELKFVREIAPGGPIEYEATHYTDTKDRPIRVFFHEAEDAYADLAPPEIRARVVKSGYQEIHRFKVVLDFGAREVQVYYTTSVVEPFMARLRGAGRLDFRQLTFDLDRVGEMASVTNVFGRWADLTGQIKKQGQFGTNVDQVKAGRGERITSLNMEYQYGKAPVDLFVGADCRLGSKSKELSNADLLTIYRELEAGLGVAEQPTE